MRLTLASVLCACLAIYCNNSNVVLSLPPSLIANAVALRQLQLQQQQQQPQLWKKDARILYDGNTETGSSSSSSNNGGINADARRLIADILPASNNNALLRPTTTTMHNKMQLEQQQQHEQQQLAQTNVADFNRKRLKEYDLDAMLAAAVANANVDVAADEAAADLATFGNVAGNVVSGRQLMPQEITPQLRALDTLKYFTPYKYWSRLCQADKNCPTEYYRAMLPDRSQAAALQRWQRFAAAAAAAEAEAVNDSAFRAADTDTDVAANEDDDDEDGAAADDDNDDEANHRDNINVGDDFYDEDINNEVFMLLSGEQDLTQFLYWAMELLYPYRSYTNLSEHAAAPYHPGMFIWKKLNLSGHLEPRLLVDEPHYVLVRREKLNDDLQLNNGQSYTDDPFIPPRGRKHNSPDLDALLRRYETFVPNRGKRDQINDIFKYDDLFYPNRGKKGNLDILKSLNDPFFPNRGKKQRDIYNVDDPFFPNRGKRKTADSGSGSGSSSWSVNDVAGGMQERNVADEDRHLTWLNGVAGAPTQLPRIFGKLERKLQLLRRQQQQQQQQEQQQHVANEIRRNVHDDVDDDDDNNNNNNDVNNDDNNDDVDEENIGSNNSNNNNINDWPQRMSTHKINGYDQSVKPSMSATAIMLTTATAATATDEPTATAANTITTRTTTSAATMRHPSRIVDQRIRRSAGSLRAFERAARLAASAAAAAAAASANRLHSTRSMSTNSQLQRQQQRQQQSLQRLWQHYNKQLQRQTHFNRQQQQQQQQQIHHKRQLSPQVQQNLRFFTKHHQVKSNNDLEPLFWRQRQLQQQQQRTQPWQKMAANDMQQHQYKRLQQQQQQPPETQLSPRFAAVDIDTDYDNFEI